MEFFDDQPTSYLDEAVQFVYDEFGLETDISTIYRTLQRKQWSRKVCQRRASERSSELRSAWRGIASQWIASQIACIDESAANERTGDRRYGWSQLGLICEQKGPYKRSERWSILPALTTEGWIDYIIYQGSITKDIYLQFLEERVLPKLRPGMILIMDNASIHRGDKVRQLCEQFGVRLYYLPPYSPDYNPIEGSFHDLKAWIRRNRVLATQFDDFENFLHFAVSQTRGLNAEKHFSHAGYVSTEV